MNETEILKKYENISLSNRNIYEMLDGKVKVLTYPELAKYNHIDDLFYPHNCFILLYMWKESYGHWVCVLKHDDRIEFFDPYGGNNLPDEELKMVPEHFRQKSNQAYPHLSWLIYNIGMPIEYNDYKFQKSKSDIKTCGRHCIVRSSLKHLKLDDYYDLMVELANKCHLDFDKLVTLFTMK
ncbi:MAG TPA: hypothetical protein VIY08_00820 [Candidatus Nitrosocosmicus sp.]